MPKINASVLKSDFLKVAKISKANSKLTKTSISVESLLAPHKPTNLPDGKMAVYVFIWKGVELKGTGWRPSIP